MIASALSGCADENTTPGDAAEAAGAPRAGGVREFDLWVAGDTSLDVGRRHPFTLRFTSDPSETGAIPGPEIRVTQGDTVRVRLHHGYHTIHWHGVRLPWDMDGVPGVSQDLGDGVFTYEFVAKDAGTFWYHCHVHAPLHIDLGMFGAFIVEPADKSEDPPFDREATLFLHEMDTRSFALVDSTDGDPRPLDNRPYSPLDYPGYVHENAATTLDEAYVTTHNEAWSNGVVLPFDFSRGYHPRYDLFVINGKSYPDTEPVPITTGETVRIRLINAGQAPHGLHMHGHRFLVTHKDGALLSAPYLADTIGLFPGERYDIYVKGDNPGMWDLHEHGSGWGTGPYASDDGYIALPGGMHTMLVYEDWEMPHELAAPEPGGFHAGGHAHHARPRG